MYLPTVAGKPIIICVSAWYFVSDSVAGLRCVILRCAWHAACAPARDESVHTNKM